MYIHKLYKKKSSRYRIDSVSAYILYHCPQVAKPSENADK